MLTSRFKIVYFLIFFCANVKSQTLVQNWYKIIDSNISYSANFGGTIKNVIALNNNKSKVSISGSYNNSPFITTLNTVDGSLRYKNQQNLIGSSWEIAYNQNNQLMSISSGFWGPNGTQIDAFQKSFDDLGNILYIDTINSTTSDFFRRLRISSDNHTIVHGITRDVTNGFQTSPAYSFDSNGKQKWSSTINDLDWYFGYEGEMTVDKKGNAIFTGKRQTGAWDISSYDIALKKVDSNGVTIWNTYFDFAGQEDVILDIVSDNAGDIYFSGASAGISATYITKLNGATGNVIWTISSPHGNNAFNYCKLAVNNNGDLINMNFIGGVTCIDPNNGNIKWTSNALNLGDGFHFPITDINGYIYLCPQGGNNDSMLIYNDAGNLIYSLKVKIPNNSININGIAPDASNNCFYVTGTATNAGIIRFFVAKYKYNQNKEKNDERKEREKFDVCIEGNPVRDQIRVHYESTKADYTSIRLINSNGQCVSTKSLGVQNKGQETFSVNQYPSGIYLVEVRIGRNTVIKKVIKN